MNLQSTDAEEKLACFVSKAHWSEHDQREARALFAHPDFLWSAFWELVSFNGVAILAAKKLVALDAPIPRPIAQHVAIISAQNTLRRQWALTLLNTLNAAHIDVYLLKGFLLGELVYHDPCYKRMNDVDILIEPSTVRAAIELLQRNGFRFATGALLSKDPLDFRLHHSPPLISDDDSTLIGLHWGLASPYARRRPRTDIFTNSHTLAIDGLPAHRMSHEHNLLHQCIHMPFFKVGLRELADVANLITHAKAALDFDQVFDGARKWHCEDALYRVLTLAHRAIPCVDEAVEQKLAALEAQLGLSRYVSDTKKRSASLRILLRSRSTYVGKIEKNFVLFKLASRYKDRARYLAAQWRHFLFVPIDERRRLLCKEPAQLNIASSLRASRAIWFALSQDLGTFFLVLITVKNLLSLAKQRLFFWRTAKEDDEATRILQSATTMMEAIE